MLSKTVQGIKLDVISPSFYTVSGYPLEISFVGDCWQLFCDDANREPIYAEFPSLDAACGKVAEAWRTCGLI